MAQANNGDVVRIHYTGKLADGTVFDSSREREPIEFELGTHQVITGINEAVEGMETGQTKTVELAPDQAYGDHDERLQQSVPKAQLPQDVAPGQWLRAQQGQQEIPVLVKEVGDAEALLDANHPLAGRTLHFEIELVDIRKG